MKDEIVEQMRYYGMRKGNKVMCELTTNLCSGNHPCTQCNIPVMVENRRNIPG